jgi:hypothetical protein
VIPAAVKVQPLWTAQCPLIHDPLTSLEATLTAPPRRPRNMARKRVAKKLKVTETTSQEVNSSSRVVEYLSCNVVYADN